MIRLMRISLATVVLLGALSVGRLALPGRTFACSCAMPGPIGEFANEPDYAEAIAAFGPGVGATVPDAKTGDVLPLAFLVAAAALALSAGLFGLIVLLVRRRRHA